MFSSNFSLLVSTIILIRPPRNETNGFREESEGEIQRGSTITKGMFQFSFEPFLYMRHLITPVIHLSPAIFVVRDEEIQENIAHEDNIDDLGEQEQKPVLRLKTNLLKERLSSEDNENFLS